MVIRRARRAQAGGQCANAIILEPGMYHNRQMWRRDGTLCGRRPGPSNSLGRMPKLLGKTGSISLKETFFAWEESDPSLGRKFFCLETPLTQQVSTLQREQIGLHLRRAAPPICYNPGWHINQPHNGQNQIHIFQNLTSPLFSHVTIRCATNSQLASSIMS